MGPTCQWAIRGRLTPNQLADTGDPPVSLTGVLTGARRRRGRRGARHRAPLGSPPVAFEPQENGASTWTWFTSGDAPRRWLGQPRRNRARASMANAYMSRNR